ncbi:MAG: GAF domain-containing sensor histidine kinase [Anaerolineales bacterium]|nr:GAF domain-containing sensor histidine kinase [Anaerolineales bacterium]
MDSLVFISVIQVAGYALGGLWAIFHQRNRPNPARLTLLYCLLALAAALLSELERAQRLAFLLPEFQTHLPIYASYCLALIFLLLSRALFVVSHGTWRWALPGVAWGVLLLALDARLIPLPEVLFFRGGWILPRTALIVFLLIASWAILFAAAAILTVQALRRTARHTILISYWALVLWLIVLADGLIFGGQAAAGGLLRLTGTLLAVYALSSSRLPSIEHTLRRVSAYFISTLFRIFIYTIILTLTLWAFRNWQRVNPLWVSLTIAVLLATLTTPLLDRLQKWSRRSILGGRQDAAGMLRQYSQNITNLLDLERLATLAVDAASDFFEVRRGYLLLVDKEKVAQDAFQYLLRHVKTANKPDVDDGVFSEESPFVVYLQRVCRPITQAEIELQPIYQRMAEGERAWLEKLGCEVYAPICAKGEWIGLLALGAKSSGAQYNPKDLNLLSTLADQTAVALENTRLVEGLMRLNNDFRRAYAALDQANRHLERLDKTKSDFISIASHELRTPLTLINGASQMLLDDPGLQENPYHQQLLQKIKIGGERLHEIVETMLDMAKIDQRTLELEPQPVSLHHLIQGLIHEMEKEAAERNQLLETQNLEQLPLVMADMPGLRKVFFHLLANAIKFTPDGGKITVSGHFIEPNVSDLPHGGVEIVVSDTGIGIDPRFHELIFVKFYQTGELALHSTGKTKFKGGGPGLGLAIARGIVEAHHGRIWVESPGYDEEQCPGSQFHVVLPLRPTDRPAPPRPFLNP